MQVMQNVARRYGLVCLLHEKPFAGVNGSGKHNNWSMGTDTGHNLLDPGDTPAENLQFLFFCAAVIQAVNKHQALLRASVANAGQDHRLGANEAPPAIISIFLGAELEKVFDAIETGKAPTSKPGLPRPRQPGAAAAAAARRRPQPHHAVRLHRQQVRVPRARLEHVAGLRQHGAEHDRRRVDRRADRQARDALQGAKGDARDARARRSSRTSGRRNKQIVFDGDGYSEEWHKEAEKRGLRTCARRRTRCRGSSRSRRSRRSRSYKVLSKRELESRYEVFVEQYAMKLNIEAETAASIARTMILPAAVRHLTELKARRRSTGLGRASSSR